MRIEALFLRDVGPFREVLFEFPPGDDPDRADVHLFVGENGTGKTTLLRALASAFDFSALDSVVRRFTSDDALVAIRWSKGIVGWGRREGEIQRTLPAPFEALRRLHGQAFPGAWFSAEGENADRILWLSNLAEVDLESWPQPRPQFAAISLAASRQASGAGVQGTAAIRSNPLRCFAGDGQRTLPIEAAQWLINTRVRASTARDEGAEPEALHYESVLQTIEDALTEMTGHPTRVRVPSKTLDAHLEIDGRMVAFDLLPDGLRAILALVAETFMRLERVPDPNGRPPTQREFALLLDEVEVHLHPRWQRQVLHSFQTLFPKAQVIASTHSPFVINSVTDAWIHPLELDGAGHAQASLPIQGNAGRSIHTILADILGVREEFGEDVEPDLVRLVQLRDLRLQGDGSVDEELHRLASDLSSQSPELESLVQYHLRVLQRRLAEGA